MMNLDPYLRRIRLCFFLFWLVLQFGCFYSNVCGPLSMAMKLELERKKAFQVFSAGFSPLILMTGSVL